MEQAQKLLSLLEAFRVVLRNCYPQRPALADEICNKAWFWYLDGKPTAEVKVADVAHSALLTAIREQRSRRGRRPGADWDAVGIVLREKIKICGMPTEDNDDQDWRKQADAEGLVAEVLDQRGESKAESTVRKNVTRILKEIEAGN